MQTQSENSDKSLTNIEQQALIERWQTVKQQLAELNPNTQLLAVSKTKPVSMITTLAYMGQQHFGENYVQEAVEKIQALQYLNLDWHYIGHIQRNKTRDLAEYFNWVHGVDRLIIAQRLNEQRPAYLPKLNICIQVNIDDEASKSGCKPEELPTLIEQISQLPNLRLRGLMIIPAKNSDTAFVKTKELFDNYQSYHHNPIDWDTLSMGMSDDMPQAVSAGSTMVRVGTAIFGKR